MRFVNLEPTGSNVECGVWNRRSLTERLLSACRCKHKSEGSNVELVALRAMLNYSIMNYN